MHFGNHTGTHIDFPAHVIQGGKTSSNFPIESLIGAGLIIEVPVLIVEGLELNNAPIGRCKIYIMPLNVPEMDGLPARVLARV